MKKIAFIFFFIFVIIKLGIAGVGSNQDSLNFDSSSVIKNDLSTKQKLVIAGLVAQQAGSLALEYKWWWEGDYHSFAIKNDGGFNNYSFKRRRQSAMLQLEYWRIFCLYLNSNSMECYSFGLRGVCWGSREYGFHGMGGGSRHVNTKLTCEC